MLKTHFSGVERFIMLLGRCFVAEQITVGACLKKGLIGIMFLFPDGEGNSTVRLSGVNSLDDF